MANFLLSERDKTRLQKMLRWFDKQVDIRYQRRRRHGGGGGGAGLRRAFVKTAPGATTTLVCFLETDTTGTEINVACDIFGGGNLDEAHPSFTDGDPLWVAFHSGEWRNVTRIDGVEDCP